MRVENPQPRETSRRPRDGRMAQAVEHVGSVEIDDEEAVELPGGLIEGNQAIYVLSGRINELKPFPLLADANDLALNFLFGVHRLPRASERRPFHEQAGNVVWGIAQELREELPFPAVTAEITRIEDSPALAFDEEGHRSKTGMIDN